MKFLEKLKLDDSGISCTKNVDSSDVVFLWTYLYRAVSVLPSVMNKLTR